MLLNASGTYASSLEISSAKRARDRLLRTKELCEVVGVTPRQVQVWEEQGVILCDSPGRNRRFPVEEGLIAAVVLRLRRAHLLRNGHMAEFAKTMRNKIKSRTPRYCMRTARGTWYGDDPSEMLQLANADAFPILVSDLWALRQKLLSVAN